MIDAHLHLGLLADPAALVTKARAAGITDLTSSNTGLGDAQRTLELAAALGCKCSLGIHPCFARDPSEAEGLRPYFASRPKGLCAVGELGFDRKSPLSLEGQKKLFRAQLKIALEFDLPVVLHLTAYGAEALALLKEIPVRGMVHWAQGSPELVKAYLKAGLYLSFCTASKVTPHFVELLRLCPVERMLFESDFDDVKARRGSYAPEAFREFLDLAAEVKAVERTDLELALDRNFAALLG